jgi:catechol 2,3-dioxygenase-like lactoylglutathione lyase family enzyme
MIRVRLIDHVVLRTANMEPMVRFYSRVLGCQVERRLPPETGLVQLRAGQSLIDLVAVDSELGRKGGGAPAASGNNMDHFCLQIEPADESSIISWLAEHGIETSEFEVRYGAQGYGPSVYLQDPDGNTVELRCAIPG